MNTIGTCSLCGGPVTVPELWGCIIPPTPRCQRCGAEKADPYGPVIKMKENPDVEKYINTWPFRRK